MKTPERAAILCVDDEPQVLLGLSRNLRKHYEVLTATSGEAALELLKDNPHIAVITSDMRMRGLSGAEFLAKARALLPEAQRIILTGQADLASAIAVVNDGQIFRYLTKPCPPPELQAAVQAAVEAYQSRSLERTVLRRKVEHVQLRIDPITGLANRLQLMETLEVAATDSTESASALVACYIDVTRSGALELASDEVWDDVVPKVLAQRLRRYCVGASFVARLSAEQFVVVLSNFAASDLELCAFGSELRRALTEPIPWNQDRLSIDVSIGIARLVDRRQWERLVQCAGLAAQEARREAASLVCLYRPEVPLQVERDRKLLLALHEAPDKGEFHLHYQPIVDVSAGRVRALECLARWTSKDLGEIAPAIFIPLAEQSGEIVHLGRWVLAQACTEGRPMIGEWNLRLAVNVSTRELMDPGFLPYVEQCLARSGIPPQALELELTESLLARDLELLRAILEQLRRLKVRIAVDDFGTGYSSLAYLSRLPIDVIKVDRVFVRDFKRGGRSIINAALTIGRDFGLEVVIEGVETADMLMQVRELGASLIQGYWLAKPMPAGRLAQWISDYHGGASSSPMPVEMPQEQPLPS